MRARHFAEVKVANPSSDEPFHFVADFIKHAADLAVQALAQDDPHLGRADRLEAGETGAFAIEKNPVEQFLRKLRIPAPIERDLVFLLHLIARVGELLREIAVARHEEETLRLGVEPADIEEPAELRREEIVDRVGRVRVAPGRDEAFRLVQDDGEGLGAPNDAVANLDVVALLDLGGKIGHRLAIDRDPAFGDQVVAMPARAEPGGSEETIKAHFS